MKEMSLLKGNIKKELITLAMPLLLGNILQQLYNLMDANNLFSGILRSVGNTKTALWVLFASVLLNGILDYLFVAKFSLSIEGAAFATVLAQSISALGCFFYLRILYRELICTRADVGFHRELLKRGLQFGFASALHESSLYIGRIFVQGAVNTLGTAGIAAYTATTMISGVSYIQCGQLPFSREQKLTPSYLPDYIPFMKRRHPEDQFYRMSPPLFPYS